MAGKHELTPKQNHYLPFKRAIDVVLSGVAIVVLSPLLLGISIAIKLDSKGPVLFKQKRVGKNKELFEIWKFRSMYTETPKDLPTHMLSNPEAYITKVGHFLRRTSLDELPQLFNIFRGQMSIIGPRPALWNQDDLIVERDRYGANDVTPGLTGWAQINGRDELEIPVKARFDGEYVERLGFCMDVKCFFGTIGSVLHSKGVVEGGTGELHKKKVLFLVNHPITIYYFRRELVERLLAEGYEVVLSSPAGEYIDTMVEMGCRYDEVKMDRHGKNPFDELKLLKYYKKLIAKEKPKVICSYTIKPNIYGALAAHACKVPLIANVTGLGTALENRGLLQTVLVTMYRLAFRHVQTVFFQNTANEEFFQKRGVAPGRHKLLPGSGVNLTYYPYAEPKQRAPGEEIFLFVGRVMKDKGIDELLEAACRIKAQYPKVEFQIAGFLDGDYADVMKRAQEEGTVNYLGQQADVRPYYRECDAVVLPSYHEGMANVLLEAAATGRPVLASDIPGCRETFEEGVTGLGFAPQNAESLYQALEHFLQLPKEERMQMGRRARKKVEKEFDRNIVVNAYIEEIKEENPLLAESSSHFSSKNKED